MYLSSLPKVLEWDLNDEIVIFSLAENDISSGEPLEFENVEKFKNNINNLVQEKIFNVASEILNENQFYEYFFRILNSEIVKKFYTSNLFLDEKDN